MMEASSIAAESTNGNRQKDKELVLSYLRRIASAARALATTTTTTTTTTNTNTTSDDGNDAMEIEENGDDCQEYLDRIARHLLQASRMDAITACVTTPLPAQLLPAVDLERDMPREEDAPTHKTWHRLDYLRQLLRAMAPIAMDVTAHMCALITVPTCHGYINNDGENDTTTSIAKKEAVAAFLLFSVWLPIAPQITPLVLDLCSLPGFPCPLDHDETTENGMALQQQQHGVFLLVQASHAMCRFFYQRAEMKIVLQWWNWSPIFALLHQTTQQQNSDNDDQEMTDASQDDNNEFGFSFLKAIRWHVARIIGHLLEVTPLARGGYFQKLNVREERVPWVIHPWIIDQEEGTTQALRVQGRAIIWTHDSFPAPSATQIRNCISSHPWLVHVGGGIVFAKHDPITSGLTESSFNKVQDVTTVKQLEASPNYLSATTKDKRQNLTRTATTAENLALLGASLCTHPHPPPILICGPHGSGKSSLVRELALIFDSASSAGGSSGSSWHHDDHLLEIHVDEETDAKTLVGSYTMTDIPGEFAWKAGALTQAVRAGKWVLIEDVDSVPIEIQAALVKLLEDRVLPLGASGKMERCHPNFRLFGTCTISDTTNGSGGRGRVGSGGGRKILNSSLWRQVHVKPLPYTELQEIALSLHPNIPPSISDSALAILKAVDCSGREATSGGMSSQDDIQQQATMMLMTGGRNPSVRDFFKLLSRISNGIVFERNTKYATESQRTLCMAECVDIFLAACPNREKRREFVRSTVAPTWGLTADIALGYLESRRPVTHVGPEHVDVGRAKLPLLPDTTRTDSDGFTETSFSLRLMESIAVGIKENEPLLLVGETGTGKTSVVQHLSQYCGRELIVQNLSLQTDSTDLLGGYRPLELQHVAHKVYRSFVDIFVATFSRKQNAQFLDFASSALAKKDWKKLSQCFVRAAKLGLDKVKQREQKGDRKETGHIASMASWRRFSNTVERFERQRLACDSGLVFTFTEGALVDAIREGKWVLLDEINLASSEILQRLLGLLDDRAGSLTLTERGDAVPVPRHPDFRLFAAMNPATDAGKKELHPSFRSRFTEIYVDELLDPIELRMVSSRYLLPVLPPSDTPAEHSDIVASSVDVYLQCRELAEEVLVDGSGHKPRFTLRTLARAMTAAKNLVIQQRIPLKRAIVEGFELAIQGPLDAKSLKAVQRVLRSALGDKIPKSERDHPGRRPGKGDPNDYVLIKPFWIQTGSLNPVDWSETTSSGRSKFILTPSAKVNLRRLARAIAAGPWPILLEGPTSAGKTTLVEYIAARVGHRVVRINNHEHTDVQEYTGSFAPDANGSLSFQDGILVRALKRGEWVILDELNLAPSEVLEALNRLLDDNRQLYLAEINQVIKPHPNFRLFATQNPCGAYGGRKPLSRAFRNRFVELHIEDIPSAEMTAILEKRCSCPPSHAKALVAVMDALRQRRSKSGVFMGKDGLITPRDLLRWAERRASSKLHLAQDGYMLLAERLRTPDEKAIVKDEIEKQLKVNIDVDELYFGQESAALKELNSFTGGVSSSTKESKLISSIAPTKSILRLMNLILRCIRQREPVLLVGDTGNGKTTVVDLLSILLKSKLRIINCHATTETSDLIGGLRPVRGRNTIVHQMHERVKELLVKWPDRDALETLIIPDYLYYDHSADEMLSEQTELPDEVMEPTLNLPETAASEMIKLVGILRDSAVLQDGDVASESPRKKPKLVETHTSEKGNEETTISSLAPIIDEIEELYRRHSSLFEWADGPVAAAMKEGDMLLLDELSLAEDAVLERLNSVLEPSRTLVLAEKGEDAHTDTEIDTRVIQADDGFRIFATMNPGGDFGKRELSPALRSRFTEIWVPPVDDRADIELVLGRSLAVADDEVRSCKILEKMLAYVEWFNTSICKNPSSPYPGLILSLRDVLAWTRFLTKSREANHDFNVWDAFCHGAALMHLDGIGLGTGLSLEEASSMSARARDFLISQVGRPDQVTAFASSSGNTRFSTAQGLFGLHPFWVQTGQHGIGESSFNFEAPKTAENVYRVLRAMQLSKPILLEGSPGVGKTSLVLALANAAGHRLVRINLSEQTDMSDLMGSDLPVPEKNVDGKLQASFKWCDGVLLTAIKNGDWVLLDELNLASQSVLEGLNSCLDYRASVFVPELGKTFQCPPTFRVFAAQNPLAQGGGRKGLPRSFLNRFTKVYVEALSGSDLRAIVASKYSSLSNDLIDSMVHFNERVHAAVVDEHQFGHAGSPWEFNLRDVFRWADLFDSEGEIDDPCACAHFASFIYLQRFRNENDRQHIRSVYSDIFGGHDILTNREVGFEVTDKRVRIGGASLERMQSEKAIGFDGYRNEPAIFQSLLSPMEAVARCIQMRWPCLLVAKPGSGKSSVVNSLSELCNADLIQVSLSPSSDVNELIGCFEQVDVEAKDKEVLLNLDAIASGYIFEYSGTTGYQNRICELLFQLNNNRGGPTDGHEMLLSRNPSLRSIATELAEELVVVARSNQRFDSKHGQSVAELTKYTKEGCLGHAIDAHFQWVDGVLARAMTQGSWLLLENVNLCPSSVLDRLNPVMEENGELFMAECGVQKDEDAQLGHRVVKAHPNFRVFLTMDPENGEISRAMRNRCVEIALLSPETSVARNSKVNADICPYGGSYVDSIDVCWRAGLRSSQLAEHVLAAYRLTCNEATSSGIEPPCIKIVAESATLASDLLDQGLSWEASLNILRSIFSLKKVPCSEQLLSGKSNRLVLNPHFRSDWLVSPRFSQVDWQGRLCRLFVECRSRLPASSQLLPDNSSVFQLSPCVESLANKYEKICPELPTDVSLSVSLRDSLMMLFLAGQNSSDVAETLAYLEGHDDPLLASYGLMAELSLGFLRTMALTNQPVALFDRLSSKNDWSSDLARLPRKVAEAIWLKRMESKSLPQQSLGHLRVLDVSFYLQNGSIDRSSISCQVTPALFPLIQATDQWIDEVSQCLARLDSEELARVSNLFRAVLTQRDRLWIFLQASTFSSREDSFLPFDEAQFIVQWKWFKTSLKSFELCHQLLIEDSLSSAKRSLDSLIDTIDNFIFGDARYHVSPSIWSKTFHPLVPCRAIQWEAIVRLRGLANWCLQSEGAAPLTDPSNAVELQDLISTRHPVLYVRKRDKLELLLAYSMLHWSSTDEITGEMRSDALPSFSNDASNAIKGQWKARQQEFFDRLDRIRIDPTINTVENMLDVDDLNKIAVSDSLEMGGQTYRSFSDGVLSSFGRMQLSSSAETYCRDEETALIRDICRVVMESSTSSHLWNSLKATIPRLRRFIDEVISWTNWPVSELRPYQTLMWACEDSSLQQGSIVKLLNYLLPVMFSALVKHSTANPSFRSGRVSAKLNMPVLFYQGSGAEENRLFPSLHGEDQDARGSHHWTHTEVLLSLISGSISPLRQRRSGAYSTLENNHARATQAQDFARILSSDSFQDSVSAPFEVNHMATETLVALKKWMPVDEGKEEMSQASFHRLLRGGEVGQLRDLFSRCSHTVFQEFFDPVVLPLFSSLSCMWTSELHPTDSYAEDLSLAQAYTGLLRFHLVLPESPLDPGRRPLAKLELNGVHIDQIHAQVAAARLTSGFRSGDFSPDSPFVNELLDRGMTLANKSASQKKKIVERVEQAPPFVELYRESREYARNFCSRDAVLHLVSLIKKSTGSESESQSARHRTKNWLKTAEAFCERLTSYFGDYEDVIVPLVDSVRLLQIGLQSLVDHCLPVTARLSMQLETVKGCLQYPIGDIFDSLACFRETMDSIPLTRTPGVQCHRALGFAALSRILMHKLAAQEFNHGAVYQCNSVLLSLVNKELEGNDEAMAIGSEEDEQERMFREQFPDHRSEFYSLLSQDEDEDTATWTAEEEVIESETGVYSPMSPDEIEKLCFLHRSLFSDEATVNDGDRCWVFRQSLSAATAILNEFGYPYLAAKGVIGTSAHVMAMSLVSPSNSAYSQLGSFRGATATTEHFYNDPNPLEVLKAVQALDSLVARITQLLTAFPGNDVLLGVFKVADTARKLDLQSTSVGKIMAALEIILRQAQDWEQHASERVQIGKPLKEVSGVVTMWRKLELQSWKGLLSSREERFCKRARRHWTRIYKVLHTGESLASLQDREIKPVCGASKEREEQWSPRWTWKGVSKWGRRLFDSLVDTTNQELFELGKVMDTFMLTSPIGEFGERLKLLKSFSNQRSCEAKGKVDAPRYLDLQCSRLLSSLGQFYEQFLPCVSKKLEALRVPIENKLRDQMKLAKWDEQSYYALAESSEKNHRNLMRCLREYDAALSLNVGMLFDQDLCLGIRSDSSTQDEACVSMPSNAMVFPLHKGDGVKSDCFPPRPTSLQSRKWTDLKAYESGDNSFAGNIKRYAIKMEGMLKQGRPNQSGWSTLGKDMLQEFCGDVFHRIDALRTEKTTRQMKERALVDLFRELKRHGYSNTKWATPKEQRQMMHVFQLPSPNVKRGRKESEVLFTKLQESEKYFLRFVAELTRLRSETEFIGSKYMSRRETEMMLNFSEHGLLMLSQQRCLLSSTLLDVQSLKKRLESFAIDNEQVLASQRKAKDLLVDARGKCRSATENARQLQFLLKVAKPLLSENNTTAWANDTVSKLESHLSILERSTAVLPEILTGKDVGAARKARQQVESMMITCRICQDQNAAIRCLPKSALDECIGQLEKAAAALDAFLQRQDFLEGDDITSLVDVVSSAVKIALVSVQGTQHTIDTEKSGDDGENGDTTGLWACHFGSTKEWTEIGVKTVNIALDAVLERMEATASHALASGILSDLGTLCDLACRLFEKKLNDFIQFYRDSAKFHYVLIRVFRVLISKGYCSDESSSEDGGDEGDAKGMTFEEKDGTGMGEGDGTEDVTDQLESEEQLLGLESDKNEADQGDKKELDEKEAEQGMEMEGQFDGEMFDMPDDPEPNDEEDEGDEDKEELDREMGLEEDPNEQVVDEKMWGESDDEEDDTEEGKEKFEKDASMKGEEQKDDQVRTKEDDEEPSGDPQNEDGAKEQPAQGSNDADENDNDNDNASDHEVNEDLEDLYEDNHGIDVRQEETAEETADEPMQLDDDLQLEDDEEDGPGDDEDAAEEDAGAEEDDKGGADAPDANQEEKEEEGDNLSDNETDENIQASGAATLPDADDEAEDNEEEEENEDKEPPRVDLPPDPAQEHEGLGVRAADGQDACQDTGMDEEDEDEGEQGAGDMEDQLETGGDTEVEKEPSGQGGTGSGQRGEEDRQDGEDSGADQARNEVPNPFKNPGDATKFWHQKLNMVESQASEDTLDAGESSAEHEESPSGEFEYAPDQQPGSAQVLGEVAEEEAVELEQQNDTQNDANDQKESGEEERKPPASKPESRKSRKMQQPKGQNEETQNREQPKADEKEDSLDSEKDGEEGAQDDQSESTTNKSDDMDSEEDDEAQGNRVVSDLSRLDIEEEAQGSQHTTMALIEDEQVTGISSEEALEARQRWARIQGDTHNLALRLCEKLRLVMEPLVKSKLRGDYRTGKRINMKRVIGYIASGYRKDKIWLRRTKPAKRNYRVLLAVDDSESMLKCGTGEMALRAMATLALGMSQLEIGELGVASFGDDMKLLHPFNQPFTSESGVDVVKNFRFNQTRTRTALCVQSALSVLEMPGDVAPLQLMFLISDGRIERDSRSTLRMLMREMMERNVLLAMIIVEPGDEKRKGKKSDSIVNMKEVSFEKGKPIVKRFIEDYPFPYYLILDDMQALPEVLGDALRQWFELLSNSS